MVSYPGTTRRWHKYHKNLIVLAVPNELALVDLYRKADEMGLQCSVFREPDIGDEVTAIALEPHEYTYKLVSSLPLALKNYAEVQRMGNQVLGGG